MSKREQGREAANTLKTFLDSFDSPESLDQFRDKKWRRGKSLSRQRLGEELQLDPQQFRQNSTMKSLLANFEQKLSDAGILGAPQKSMDITTQQQGAENEEALKSFIEKKKTEGTPFPVNHHGTLYLRAFWAEMSEQPLEEVARAPSWFSKRPESRALLEKLSAQVVNEEVPTVDMSGESAMDDMTSHMTNRMIAKLKSELKNAQEKLESERNEKEKMEQELRQYRIKDQLRLEGNAKEPRMD